MMQSVSITGWKRAALAVLMAYALVLQAMLVSLSGAAHAAGVAGPQTILCMQSGAPQPDQDPAKAHDGFCCTLSCHGPAQAGPLPMAVSIDRPEAAPMASILAKRSSRFSAFSHGLPVGSRAPPRLG